MPPFQRSDLAIDPFANPAHTGSTNRYPDILLEYAKTSHSAAFAGNLMFCWSFGADPTHGIKGFPISWAR
jgi:hypothetical protein